MFNRLGKVGEHLFLLWKFSNPYHELIKIILLINFSFFDPLNIFQLPLLLSLSHLLHVEKNSVDI